MNSSGPPIVGFTSYGGANTNYTCTCNNPNIGLDGICDQNMQFRNSFYWGPRQYALLSTSDITNLTTSDYRVARLRNWLHTKSTDVTCSETLTMQREPSPDGATDGQMTWYGYTGRQADYHYEGTNTKPAWVAWLLPDGTTHYTYYEYNWLGHVTLMAETYTSGNSILLRTNTYTYSSDGINLVKIVGPDGVTRAGYNYSGNRQVLFSTNAVGDVAQYLYNGMGQTSCIKTPSGLTTTNIYFSSGTSANFLATSIDLEINRTNSFTYTNGLMYSHTDERGLSTTNSWDALQRVIRVNYPDNSYISNTYANLDLIRTRDRMGFQRVYVYDNMRRLTAWTNANNAFGLYSYCNCGSLGSFVDALNNTNLYYYDNQGRRTATVFPDLYAVTNNFDSLGRIQWTVDSAGTRITNWFNNQGLRYAVTTVSGNREYISFDINDRGTNIVDTEGVSITNTFDNLGRLLTRKYPDGGTEKFGYSAAGLVAYTNQIGMTNFFVYDAARRKIFETNANNELVRYTNNAAGDLLALVDGKGQVTKWNYDQFGRVTNKLDQAGTEILRYSYDLNNRLTNRWSATKGNTVYTYDPVANLTNINYPTSSDVAFAYDPMNRMTNMVDGSGTTKYTYSAAGQLLTEDGPFTSDTVTNAYSNRLRTKLSLQQPTGLWTNAFTYDQVKRLTNVNSSAGAFGYLYESGLFTHHASLITLPNTSYVTNAFDSDARLIATYLKKSDNTTFDSYVYIYNPANQRTNVARTDGSTVAYKYDNIGQLTIADSSVSAEDFGYTYDSAWNLSYRTNNGALSTFSVNGLNEMIGAPWPGGFSGVTINYDTNGNLIKATIGAHRTSTYLYDDENRLTNMIAFGGGVNWQTTFFYDGLGRLRKRIEYDANTNIVSQTAYIYDGWRVIQERNAANNTPTVSYTRGNDLSGSMEGAGGIGGLLARSDGYSSGNFTTHNYYFADGNGNITYMLNSSQSMVASYRYDPFGNTNSASGTLANANVYRFSSKETHANSGMYYYGYRFYDPNLQRWINRDPLGGYPSVELKALAGQIYHLSPWEFYEGPNLYTYACNAPIDLSDIDGLWTVGIGGRAGYGFFVAGDVSLGFYFGHSKQNGWSFGFLETTFVGEGGPPNMSAGIFAQVTTADCVGQLKGFGFDAGASGGEGPGGGGDWVFGSGYQGGSVWGGITGGSPVEVHAGGTITSGWDSGKGWHY